MPHPLRRASGSLPVLLLAAALPLLISCASGGRPMLQEPCRLMKAQIEEKQELDAKVKALEKQAVRYRKQGDTASAASAEHRLTGLRENQRLLKESLEQSSRDCSPTWQNQEPVRDPARREYLETR